jgi:nitrite reductase/ring-hydroxylating ferredoxin subunit/uncharacterized membrane protein
VNNPLTAIEQAQALDKPSKALISALSKVIPPGPVKDALTGKWQGHPVHPVLTDIPIGLWTSSVLLDVLGGKKSQDAAQTLLGLGITSAIPTVAAGVADWLDTYGDEQRIGLVHAAGNVTAIVIYTASYLARRRGSHGLGVALSLAATGVLAGAGFLGGHLVYRMGSGVDQTRFAHYPSDWTAVLPAADLPAQQAVAADLGDSKVMLYKDGGTICALADKCSHRGGPLHEGKIDPAAMTVTCPWHASVFDMRTGAAEHGPASAPQPCFEARVSGDQVEVRLRPS